MKFYKTLISVLLLTVITQYSRQKEVQAYPSCRRYSDLIRSPEKLKKISYWTDYFFVLVRPEMRDKKIKVSYNSDKSHCTKTLISYVNEGQGPKQVHL